MPQLDDILSKGGEFDPALKRSRLEALYGPGYKNYITPEGHFEIPVGQVVPEFSGPLAPQQQGPSPLKRGMLSTASDLMNAGGLLSEMVGADDWSQALYEKAQDYQQRLDQIPQRVAQVEDIKSVKDAAIYAYERIAENVPMLATLLLPGGLVSAGARGIGMGARAARAAGWTASFLTDIGLQTGESVDVAKAAGKDPNDIRVIGSGLGKAALDFVPFFSLATKLGIGPLVQKELIKNLAEKGFIKRAASHIGTLLVTEVPTEVMQQGIDIALDRSLEQKSGALTDDEMSQLKNAAAGAAAVSLGLGGAAGAVSPREATHGELHAASDAASDKNEVSSIIPTSEPVPVQDVHYPGQYVPDVGPFDYSSAFDERTGEMSITGKEYQKALIEQGRQIKYDPFSDAMTGTDIKPGLTPTRTGWYFDVKAGAFTYDQGKAQVRMTPEGFQTSLASGADLGTFQTPEEAMAAGEKFAYDSEPISGVSTSGEYKYEQQDASKRLAIALKQQVQRTPTEEALVSIEDARASGKVDQFDPQVKEDVHAAQMEPAIQKLLDARMEFLADKSNYRSTDQGLKNASKGQLAKLDSRIETISQKLGVPNPLKHDNDLRGENTEDVFEQRAKDTDKVKYPNLTESEAQLLDALEEKERTPGEGLTVKEYEKLERLIAKRKEDIGVPESERQKVSDEEIDKMVEEMKDRYRNEYTLTKNEKTMPAVMDFPRLESAIGDGPGSLEGDPNYEVTHKGEIVGEIFNADSLASRDGFDIDTALQKELDTRGGVLARNENGSAWFPNKEAAFHWLSSQHLNSRSDLTRRPAMRNTSGQLARSLVTPERKQQEIAIIKAVRKLYDGLQIKPRVDFAHSWNTDVFPEGTSIQKAVKNYRGFIQLRDGGRVFMVLDNLKDADEAERTFVHEVLAHYGLRAYFKPKELEQILRTVAKERGDEVFRHRNENAAKAGEGTPVGTLSLEQAEEFIASKFEELHRNGANADRSFTDKIASLFRRFLRHLGISKWSDKDIGDVMRDIGKGLTRGVIRDNTRGYFWSHATESNSLPALIGRDSARLVEGDINTLGEVWRAKALLGVLTPLQAAERFNVDGAKSYIETTMKWFGRKHTLTNSATEVAEEWQKVPKRHAERLASSIFAAAEKSDEVGRRLTPEELRKIFNENGVTQDGIELYTKIDKEFQTVLTNLETGLKTAALRQHASTTAEAQELHDLWKQVDKTEFFKRTKEFMGNLEIGARLSDIENQINHLRDRNYFPYSRFGEYALTVRAKSDLLYRGQDYRGPTADKRGQVVHFETFENASAQKERFEQLGKEFPQHSYSLHSSVLSEQEFSFLGMPPALLDLIRDHIKLDDKQSEDLKELFYLRSPGRAFLRHLVKRRGTAGYSQDALRVFASYMTNAANHVARVEYNADLSDHLSTMRKFAQENGNVAGIVSNYFQKHFDYLMNPKNDLAQIRALGFLWYLGFNVKSALVNLTQVPMVAFPYLASVHGDVKAVGALANAYKRVVDWRRGKSVLSPEFEGYVKRGIAEGFLSESRMTELAGLAEGGVLHRLLPTDKGARLIQQTAYYGSYLFKHAENFNREVVFLASLDLSKARGIEGEAAFKAGRKAVQTTMFEYAKWNRPEFMRGKKSVFFLFWNYMQHLSYAAFGGEGKKTAIRINLMLLAAAGLQGLPFAENILDLIDWGSTEVKELFGIANPRTELREDIRKLATEMTGRPDLVMHGLSRYYGLGVLNLAELLGLPVPQVDISGSLGAGEPIPGIREAVEPSRDPDKKLGAVTVSALGPVAGVGYTFWKAMMSQDPDTWKVWERAMPTAIRTASQALRRSERGEESFRGGGAIAKFDPLNTEHRLELIANAFGFAPTRISQAGELRSAQEDLRQYWLTRRAMTMENFAWASLSEDLETKADAREAVSRFNQDAPSPKLRISPDHIRESLEQRTRQRTLREQGLPNEKAFQPLYLRMKPLYEDEEPAR